MDRLPRVLVVDDQPANVRILAAALRKDCDVVACHDGESALGLAAAGDIDLILLDVVMPGVDGFEVCRRLKAEVRTRRIPVIFVTALEDMRDETTGFDVGGVDYITKPIRAPIVRARVRTHLALKQAQDLLESLASIDAVTGIANRRRFDEALDQEWKRAARSGARLSIAIADIDFFKAVNDLYGHARGDDALRRVAHALRGIARRPSDLVARYGGEEFGLVFPESDAAAMFALLRAALAAVRELAIPHTGSQAASHVTISLGAVTVTPANGGQPQEALEVADRLLYDAKHGGRNQARYRDGFDGESSVLN
jgi:diguanylate cyclase (GGDEF)-like protein